ncbi:MAG: hypothetical protein ABI791_11795 [Acidobacteriota bacterium]
MFLSNPARYFVICTFFLAAGTGCGLWQNTTGHAVRPLEPERSAAPFSTKEPETYQAEIVITAGGRERRIFAARKGTRSRIDYDHGTPGQRTVIRAVPDLVYSERLGIYAETATGKPGQPLSELETDVTASLLNRRPDTTYESLGRENGLSKFRALSDENRSSEVIVFVDDNIGIPVKQEFYSVGSDGQKVLQYTMEIRDLKLEADDALFTIPNQARKVPLAEFNRMTRQN